MKTLIIPYCKINDMSINTIKMIDRYIKYKCWNMLGFMLGIKVTKYISWHDDAKTRSTIIEYE